MPNHISNIVKLDRNVEKVQAFMKGADSAFDFNKLIPMPEGLENTTSPGDSPNWYDWSIANWGTKWNCYEVSATTDGFMFDTAWSTPVPIFGALSEKFPEVIVTVEYADEDIGNNCGVLTFHGGVIVSDEDKSGDDRFACRVKSYDYEDYIKEQE